MDEQEQKKTGKTVLAVDDDEVVLTYLEAVIESGGYKFVGVKSGAECLATLGETVPSLILLDVEMKDMDGFQTLEQIRERFPKLTAPVAFLTGRKDIAMIERASKLGSKAFIIKPVEPARLLERIKELASGLKPIMY